MSASGVARLFRDLCSRAAVRRVDRYGYSSAEYVEVAVYYLDLVGAFMLLKAAERLTTIRAEYFDPSEITHEPRPYLAGMTSVRREIHTAKPLAARSAVECTASTRCGRPAPPRSTTHSRWLRTCSH